VVVQYIQEHRAFLKLTDALPHWDAHDEATTWSRCARTGTAHILSFPFLSVTNLFPPEALSLTKPTASCTIFSRLTIEQTCYILVIENFCSIQSDRHSKIMGNRSRTLEMQADRIEAVLARHRVQARVEGGTVTPRFIRFRLVADGSTRVNKITALADEIAMELDRREARVYREGAAIQVEVPRAQPAPVRLLPLCDGFAATPPLTAVLGLEQNGTPLLLRLPAPNVAHVLVVGTTGSGKTALVRSLLVSLAMYNRQSQMQLILLDPKGRGFGPLSACRTRSAASPAHRRKRQSGCAGWSRRWSAATARAKTVRRWWWASTNWPTC
jgi:hypothetical protein